MLLTCNDQLQTPMASDSTAMVRLRPEDDGCCAIEGTSYRKTGAMATRVARRGLRLSFVFVTPNTPAPGVTNPRRGYECCDVMRDSRQLSAILVNARPRTT